MHKMKSVGFTVVKNFCLAKCTAYNYTEMEIRKIVKNVLCIIETHVATCNTEMK